MKRNITILSVAAVILAGCVVTSVSPYYTEKDLVNEPAILGHWINAKTPDEAWIFDRATNLACRLTVAESSKTTVMETHAFALRGQLFLDIYSLEQDYHVIPAHYLLKVDRLTPTLKTSELDEAWLKSLLADQPQAIRHHLVRNSDDPDTSRVVLTGNTTELQAFVLRYMKSKDAWKDAIELKRDTPTKTAQLKGQL